MKRIPERNLFARLLDPLAIYFGEFPFEVTSFQAYNLKNLVSTPFSPNQENRGARDTQELGYEFHRRFVRFAFNSRRIEADHQLPFAISSEFIFPGVGNNPYPEFSGQRQRSPNKAVPMRTIVAPSSIATSKS